MARWTCLWVLALLFVAGCSDRTTTPPPAERPGLFTIDTDLGPVDILAFDDVEGTRTLRLHAVYPDGHHAVRTLRIDLTENPERSDVTRLVRTVHGEAGERVRITQDVSEDGNGLDAVYEAGGERLRLIAFTEGRQVRFRAELARGGEARVWENLLDPARAQDPDYLRAVQASFAAFYGTGPFRENEDLALLVAVEGSADWSAYLTEVPLGQSGTSTTERNIHRVCTAAAVIGKVSCFAARFTPWAMIGCVPATGISIACIAYNVAQITMEPDPIPDPRPCDCGCSCGTD